MTETRVLALAVSLLVLVLLVGLGGQVVARAEAVDPDLEFEMEVVNGTPFGGGGCSTVGTTPTQKGDAVCVIAAESSFTVGVQLTDVGALTGQVGQWQAVIGWTSGLEGPGDPTSPKAFGFRAGHECPGLGEGAAPFVLQPRTAALGCSALPPPFTDAEATSIIADFELTCGADLSQELITMIPELLPGVPDSGTIVMDAALQPFADKDGSEVITILCSGPVGGIAERPGVATAPSEASSGPNVSAVLLGVAGMAALVVGMGGVGWYVKRRWRR